MGRGLACSCSSLLRGQWVWRCYISEALFQHTVRLKHWSIYKVRASVVRLAAGRRSPAAVVRAGSGWFGLIDVHPPFFCCRFVLETSRCSERERKCGDSPPGWAGSCFQAAVQHRHPVREEVVDVEGELHDDRLWRRDSFVMEPRWGLVASGIMLLLLLLLRLPVEELKLR